MATRLTLSIQDRFDQLSPSEQKLASLILEREDEILTYSATELAGLAGVSKATAARLFQNLGYRDFTEVRLQAREERNRTAPAHRFAAPVATPAAPGSLASHLQVELANLTRTFEELRSDLVTEAVQLLAEAPHLWVLGLGAEEGLARYARLLLARLRPEVQLLGGHVGAWAEDLAAAGASDGLLVIASQRRLRPVLAVLDHGRTARLRMLALVDPTSIAAVRRAGALGIACHAVGPLLGPSHTAALSVLRLLALSLATRLGSSALRRMDLIQDIQDELGELDG